MGLLAYGLVALAIIGALGGIGYKVREAGFDACKVEWTQANAAATAKAETQRQADEQLSRTQAAALEATLSKQRKVNRELLTVVEAHIKAARIPAECRLSPDLVRDWNRASNPTAQDPASGGVPDAGRTAPATDGRKPSGAAAKPSGGG